MSDPPSRDELRRRGADVLSRLGHGTNPPRTRPLYLASVEGMEHYTGEALWGSVWSRPGLTLRLRVLLTVSILATLQRLPQLRTYLNSALNAGLDPGEVREALIQCSAFAGFPATVNALELFREVIDARETSVERGQITEVDLDELAARGGRLQQRFFGDSGETRAPDRLEASDVLDGLEREFVFGELFHRPGLDLPARAVCALASVVALRLPDDQRAWAAGCLHAGVAPEAIGEVVLQTAYYAGFPAATAAMRIVDEVITDRMGADKRTRAAKKDSTAAPEDHPYRPPPTITS
jgi:4-carboxymuconolactone decarboxylase